MSHLCGDLIGSLGLHTIIFLMKKDILLKREEKGTKAEDKKQLLGQQRKKRKRDKHKISTAGQYYESGMVDEGDF